MVALVTTVSAAEDDVYAVDDEVTLMHGLACATETLNYVGDSPKISVSRTIILLLFFC